MLFCNFWKKTSKKQSFLCFQKLFSECMAVMHLSMTAMAASMADATYTALQISTNSVPSLNGITQDTGDWELTVQGYRLGSQYNQNPDLRDTATDWNSAIAYRTGDIVRFGGWLYHALRDNIGTEPDD